MSSLLSEQVLREIDERVQLALDARLPQTAEPMEYLDIKTASARFDIPVDTLRKWIDRKKIRRYGRGRKVLVKVAEVLGVEG